MSVFIHTHARDNWSLTPKEQAENEDRLDVHALMEALKSHRYLLGYSQMQVAQRMGIKQATFSELENIVIDYRISTLQRYARALGFKLEFTLKKRDN